MENDEDEVLPDASAASSPVAVDPKAESEDDTKPAADADKTSGEVKLADLFLDDDDDDEFPGSSAVEAKAESVPPESAR